MLTRDEIFMTLMLAYPDLVNIEERNAATEGWFKLRSELVAANDPKARLHHTGSGMTMTSPYHTSEYKKWRGSQELTTLLLEHIERANQTT